MDEAAARFVALVREYRLKDRDPTIDETLWLIRHGKLPPAAVLACVHHAEQMVEELRTRPVFLARPPSSLPPADAEIGSLVEVEGVRCGFRLRGAIHSLFVGMTGSGKTTAMRRAIHATDARNREGSASTSMFVLDRKGGDYVDIPDRLGRDRGSLFRSMTACDWACRIQSVCR